jgi:hypothetical protein
MIRKSTCLRLSTTLATAVALTLFASCGEQPTEALLSLDGMAYLSLGDTGLPVGGTNAVTPSTNEDNKANGWAYVAWNSDDAGPGEAPLKFVSTRNFASCFEYRIDDEPPMDPDNFNTDITDGLWPYVCISDETKEMTLMAEDYVDVRLVFGAERDERFDWTRFPVLGKDDCKRGGWIPLEFRNQGQCVRYIQTGRDSRSSVEF